MDGGGEGGREGGREGGGESGGRNKDDFDLVYTYASSYAINSLCGVGGDEL